MNKCFSIIFAGLFLVISTKMAIADTDTTSTTTTSAASATSLKSISSDNVLKILNDLKAKGYQVVYKVVVTNGYVNVKAMDARGVGIPLTYDTQGNIVEPKDFETQTPAISLMDAVTKVAAGGSSNLGIVVLDDDNNYMVLSYDANGNANKVVVDAKTGNITPLKD